MQACCLFLQDLEPRFNEMASYLISQALLVGGQQRPANSSSCKACTLRLGWVGPFMQLPADPHGTRPYGSDPDCNPCPSPSSAAAWAHPGGASPKWRHPKRVPRPGELEGLLGEARACLQGRRGPVARPYQAEPCTVWKGMVSHLKKAAIRAPMGDCLCPAPPMDMLPSTTHR